jgi:hypothetical protein
MLRCLVGQPPPRIPFVPEADTLPLSLLSLHRPLIRSTLPSHFLILFFLCFMVCGLRAHLVANPSGDVSSTIRRRARPSCWKLRSIGILLAGAVRIECYWQCRVQWANGTLGLEGAVYSDCGSGSLNCKLVNCLRLLSNVWELRALYTRLIPRFLCLILHDLIA